MTKLNSTEFSPERSKLDLVLPWEASPLRGTLGARRGGALHRTDRRNSREGDGAQLSPRAVPAKVQSFVFPACVCLCCGHAPLPGWHSFPTRCSDPRSHWCRRDARGLLPLHATGARSQHGISPPLLPKFPVGNTSSCSWAHPVLPHAPQAPRCQQPPWAELPTPRATRLPTYTEECVSSAVPAIRSGLCSSLGGTGVLHGGSGGLTGGRVITGLSPWDRGLGTPSYSPVRLEMTNTEHEALVQG